MYVFDSALSANGKDFELMPDACHPPGRDGRAVTLRRLRKAAPGSDVLPQFAMKGAAETL